MKRLLASVVLIASCLAAPQASAAPISVTEGSSLTFNFDFGAAGISLPVPWVAISFGIQTSSVFNDGATDSGSMTVFGGLNGTGTTIGTYGWNDISVNIATQRLDADLVDGIFSVVYGVTAGSMEFDVPVASLLDSRNQLLAQMEGVLAGQGPTNDVPEPASAFLAGLALAALAFLARRNKKNA